MNPPYLAVIVPAFNEESRLRTSLEHIVSYLRGRGLTFEVIVVDDGSTDRTFDVALSCSFQCGESECLRVLRNRENRGKGYSVRRGMLEATAEFGLLTDADLSTPIEDLARLESKLANGTADLAFGSRDLPDSDIRRRQPWYRENAGKTFNRVVRLLTSLSYRDTQCGFKLFRLDACREIFRKQSIEQFAFDVEVLFIARKWGLRSVEVPVSWSHAEGSKVHLGRDAFRTALDLLTIRWNDFRGLYDR